MSYQGDILLVENDPLVLDGLKDLFELKGYGVFAASTLRQANDVLADKHIDLAIIDVRLSDDDDTYDRSGIRLAEEMDPNIAKLLLSAFDEFVFGPNLPQNVWTFAKQRGPQEILAQVSRIFRESIRVNRDLRIETDHGLSLPSLIRQIKAYRACSPEEASLVAQEFEKLLRRLFLRETRIKLSHLSPGRGGSGVVLVRPFYASQGTSGKGAYIVVKFGLREDLVQEVYHYEEYVEPFLQINATSIIGDVAKTRHLAGVKFRFLGASHGKARDFATLFADKKLSNKVMGKIIRHLFSESCALWYGNKWKWDASHGDHSLIESYKKQLKLFAPADWQEVKDEVEALLDGQATRLVSFSRLSSAHLMMCKARHKEELLDPLAFVDKHPEHFPNPSYCCITHGDLNARNVFADIKNNTWLIDFFRTGWGPALRDVAELESVVKFELVKSQNLSALIDFERVLLAPNHFSQPITLPTSLNNKEFARALYTIQEIRRAATQIVEQDNMLEYYASLLFYALKMMTWDGFSSIDQERKAIRQRHALYSAAKICEKLGVGSRE